METNEERRSAATSVELLLVVLGGCTGSDIVDILRKKSEQIAESPHIESLTSPPQRVRCCREDSAALFWEPAICV